MREPNDILHQSGLAEPVSKLEMVSDHPVMRSDAPPHYPACPMPPAGFYSAEDLALPVACGAVIGLLLALVVVVSVLSRRTPR